MKFYKALILAIIGSLVGSLIPYFLNYLPLPFVVITFLLALILLMNLYSIPEFNARIGKLEKTFSPIVKAIVDAFINIRERLLKSKTVTMDDFVNAFDEAVASISKTVMDEYFSMHSEKSGNPNAHDERRKRELLEKARRKQISYTEAEELRRLLEEQKRRHEAGGDVGGAILLGLLILFVLAILAALSGRRE